MEGRRERAYEFDSSFRIKSPDGFPWPHQVPVEWVSNFLEIRILLGAEQLTVKELSAYEVKRLEEVVNKAAQANKQIEALEGEVRSAEAIFRSRNRALIQAKKANSNYRCEVCQFNFEETYGTVGREYIVAHHLKTIAGGPSKTTLDDIALVCANCHAMIHTRNPPISIAELRKLVAQH